VEYADIAAAGTVVSRASSPDRNREVFMSRIKRGWEPLVFFVSCIIGLVAVCDVAGARGQIPAPGAHSVVVFEAAGVHFNPDDPQAFATATVKAEDNGRIAVTHVDLPESEGATRIVAVVAVHPVAKDERSVQDKWDRAGHVRLVRENEPDIEVVKFITAYGGCTEHRVDVSHLAPVLRGTCTLIVFIDTWVTPAWRVDFRLEYEPLEAGPQPVWARGVCFEPSYDAQRYGAGGIRARVEIPEGLDRVLMHYLASGHCTDGRDADEFVSKDNVIRVDERVVYRFRPWRDDCRQFRALNPYCARWSDGTWSSDYDRSGWCPGDYVAPVELDLSDHLSAGIHTVECVVEDVRRLDEDGHYGYWRISAHLTGWRTP
jgi:hypothetical protein